LLVRRPDARFLIVNRKEHELIRRLAAAQVIPADRIELVSAAHDEVPALIQRMHLGAALIKPSYSKIASAPTKMAEYLGCGVPCLGNTGVGDVAEVLKGRRVGVVLQDLEAASIAAAVDEALRLVEDPALPARCEATAQELFSLEHGVAAYREIYQSLLPQA
jgi:glycosyltransferase involved in cell wall biosynthesis